MRKNNYFPAFMLGVLMIFPIQLLAQEIDKTLTHYLEKTVESDSTIYYHKKIVDYTRHKPSLSNYLLNSAIKVCQRSSEPYTAPTQRTLIQDIYNAIEKGNAPIKIDAKLNGYRILGDYYHANYDLDQSLKYYNHALSISDTSQTPLNEKYLSVLFTNLSDVYLDLREFNKARLLIEKTIELDIKNMGTTSEFLGLDYINLATTYQRSDPKKSLDYFLKAKNQLKKVKEKNQTISEIHAFEYLYVLIANNYLLLDNSQQALMEIDTALTITKNKNGRSNLIYGEALETKAVILQQIKQFQEALRYHDRAEKFFKNKKPEIIFKPKILLQKARCHLGLNQPKLALQQIEQAFYLIDQSGDLDQSRFDKALFPEELLQLYFEEAKILSKWYEIRPEIDLLYRSQKAYQKALVIFEKMKQTVSDQQSRQVFMNNNAGFFESAIELNFKLWEEHNDSSALVNILLLSEKSKNNFLYESLNKTNTSLTKELPDSVLAQIQSLDLRISQTEKKLFEAKSKNQKNNISSIRDNLIKYREDQKIKMQDIEKKYPQFYQLKFNVSVPDLTTLQKELKTDEGIISYYVGTHHLYVLIMDRWNFSVERVPMDFSLSQKLNTFNNSIITSTGKSAAAQKALVEYHETGFFLYQKLIEPFIRKLPARLIILPDNLLENLSFEALLTQIPTNKRDYLNYPFLLNKYTISYQYSLDAICRKTTNTKTPHHHLLAIAPTFDGEQPFSIAQLRDFGQLTHNRLEVDNIKKIIGSGSVLKNTEATEDNFLKLAPDYQIIHLATHGKVNVEHPNYSYLAFQEIKDSLENELLYIKDIYGLQLSADLVVLSACETANGSLAKGEGIINLARGFTYAGASSVVPTLWKISDLATAKLMENFYVKLKAGQPKHIAMANAKRQFLATAPPDSKHPFYWAAFVMIGDVSPILLPKTYESIFQLNTLWWGTGTIFFLLLGLFGYFRFGK